MHVNKQKPHNDVLGQKKIPPPPPRKRPPPPPPKKKKKNPKKPPKTRHRPVKNINGYDFQDYKQWQGLLCDYFAKSVQDQQTSEEEVWRICATQQTVNITFSSSGNYDSYSIALSVSCHKLNNINYVLEPCKSHVGSWPSRSPQQGRWQTWKNPCSPSVRHTERA